MMEYSRFRWASVLFMVLLTAAIAGYFYGCIPVMVPVLLTVMYLSVLAAGSYFIRMNFYFPSLNQLPRYKIILHEASPVLRERERNIVLTFDDGPHANTPAVLDILKQEKVAAVFFLIGQHAAVHTAMVKRIREEGHQVGNHSYYHKASFDWQSVQTMVKEIEQTNMVLENIIGEPVYLFRPPFGVTNPNLGKAIRRSGMHSIGWSVRSYDTVAKSEEKLTDRIINLLHPGAIVLLHERCDITVRILPVLIRRAKSMGYTFTVL